MADGPEILCFQCAQVVGDPPRLNELPDGEVCPACRDRVLDALPAALPAREPRTEPAARDGDAARDDAQRDDARS